MNKDLESSLATGINFLHESNMAREINLDFSRALSLADSAILAFVDEGDYYGVAESYCARVLVFRSLAKRSSNMVYSTMALSEAQLAVEIAQEHEVSTAIPLQNLAKTQQELGLEKEALENFRLSLEAQLNNPHKTQNRPGVLANCQELYATAQLLLQDGDLEDAYVRANQALQDLQDSDEDEMNKAVWLAHGHGRIARALKDRDGKVARTHYERARDIITTHPQLRLSNSLLSDLDRLFEN